MCFIVLVETISGLIRPITLAVRLIANMVAGHLLLTLVGNCIIRDASVLITLPTQTLLMLLELAMAGIQAYVITTLLFLYVREVY